MLRLESKWRHLKDVVTLYWSQVHFRWDWEWPDCEWTLELPWTWDAIAFTNTVLLSSVTVSTLTLLYCRAQHNREKLEQEHQRQLVYQRLLKLVVEKVIQRHLANVGKPVEDEISFLSNKARYLRMLQTAINEVSERTLLGNRDPSGLLQEDKYFKELNLKIDKIKEEICVLLKRMKRLKVDEIFSPELAPIIAELELEC